MAKGKYSLKQEIVMKLLDNVEEAQMGELLRQKAGLKNSLRGKPGNDLLSRTLTFVLDRLVDSEKESTHQDEGMDPGDAASNDVKIVTNLLEKGKSLTTKQK